MAKNSRLLSSAARQQIHFFGQLSRKSRRWKVHEGLICWYSEYFRNGTVPRTTPGDSMNTAPGTTTIFTATGFQESRTGRFDLANENPAAFELFLDWLYSNNKDALDFSVAGTSDTDDKAWKVFAVKASMIADKFLVADFAKFALGKVIQYASLLDVFDMETVYEEVPAGTPIRLFAARWVRFRLSQRPNLWESSHSRQFQKDRRRREPARGSDIGHAVLDPRSFEIVHWFNECGRTGAACGHATIPVPAPVSARSSKTTTGKAKKEDLDRVWQKRKQTRQPV
ncbi:uncharacterized protein Z518_04462 [Rhinocladiella mackenziei CBS 650.93]|uniref:BTB domain-containing protein n=1 Tax=Rhinocladiella mackenziei CBS 650.93 TaxID=1442369 RepID=A0A0D2ITK3_9EURO|nr:uncharacterized protein Z518_04462 [Rhinocladiella mackenziei CBS 650.93]KIX06486.1 hypothetical protein Z518_04462 [Rhinocladiella mackenziei CBS 650.93]